MSGRREDSLREFFDSWTEDIAQDDGSTKSRIMWKCILCGLTKVFSNVTRIRNHLSGDAEQCKSNGGIGSCLSAPTALKQKFYRIAVSKAHDKTAAAVSATARAAIEARAAAAAATADAADGGGKRPRVSLGAIEKAFQKSTADKVDDACAALFFA